MDDEAAHHHGQREAVVTFAIGFIFGCITGAACLLALSYVLTVQDRKRGEKMPESFVVSYAEGVGDMENERLKRLAAQGLVRLTPATPDVKLRVAETAK